MRSPAFDAFTESPAFSEWLTTPDGEAFAKSEFGWDWCLRLARDCRRFVNAMKVEEACTDYALPPGPERDAKYRRAMERYRKAVQERQTKRERRAA